MKTIAKLGLITASFAALVGTAALADDPQLQNRLAVARAQAEAKHETTIALYGHGRALIQREAVEEQAKTRFELHPNGHGGVTGSYLEER